MAATVIIEGKALGQKRPIFNDWRMSLPPDTERTGGRLTLRALITRVVHEEVTAFRERQEQRTLIRALTKREIEEAAERGKVDMGGRDTPLQEVETEEAVGAALLAFEDGLYYVFIDGERATALDHEVYLKPDSRITFLRLVALAGGF